MIALRKKRSAWVLCGMAVLAVGCGREFATESRRVVIPLEAEPWPDTLAVSDTTTVTIELRLASDVGPHVKLHNVEWRSSDDAVLQLTELAVPEAVQSTADSLTYQLSAHVRARAHGSAEITVTAEQQGFERAVAKDTVVVMEKWIAITAGGPQSCGLTVDSTAYCWGGIGISIEVIGYNLGVGNGSDRGSDVPVRVVNVPRMSAISAGHAHTCGLGVPTGLLFCWGTNELGQLGNGTFIDQLVPVIAAAGQTALMVSAGDGATCSIGPPITTGPDGFPTGFGNTYCWGSGVVRTGQPGSSASPVPEVMSSELLVATDNFAAISVGIDHTCGVLDAPLKGKVLCRGYNDRGQLGRNSSSTKEEFVRVESDTPVSFSTVSAGYKHNCGVTTDGEVYCWGDNSWGQLGNGSEVGFSAVAVRVADLPATAAVSVAGASGAHGPNNPHALPGAAHVCALTKQGEVYCWGANAWGQLGSGEFGDRSTPVRVVSPPGESLTFESVDAGAGYTISAGYLEAGHTCGIARTTGAAYCWGYNGRGQLGNGSTSWGTPIFIPVRVAEPQP